jgi:hypothetical protein
MGLKLNGTLHLAYANDMNLLGDNVDIINKNRNINNASKQVKIGT